MRGTVTLFFFSSRRRHTRFDCDWSSDVCSSDLASPRAAATLFDGMLRARGRALRVPAATARRAPAVAASTPPASPPVVGTLRSFVVCAKLDCSQFKTVGARAQAVGAPVAIYVDHLAPEVGL